MLDLLPNIESISKHTGRYVLMQHDPVHLCKPPIPSQKPQMTLHKSPVHCCKSRILPHKFFSTFPQAPSILSQVTCKRLVHAPPPSHLPSMHGQYHRISNRSNVDSTKPHAADKRFVPAFQHIYRHLGMEEGHLAEIAPSRMLSPASL